MVGQSTLLGCRAVCGGGAQEGTIPLVQLSDSFQSLPLLPTSKFGPSGGWFPGGWVCVHSRTLLVSPMNSPEAGSFSCHHNPNRFLQSELLKLYVPILEPRVARSVSLSSYSSQFIHIQIWAHAVLQPLPCCMSSPHLLACLYPSYQSRWMSLL